MKKLTPTQQREALERIRVINAWDLLSRFGDAGIDCAAEYTAKLAGRMGWGSTSHSTVWGFVDANRIFKKVFEGNRKQTFAPAIAWANERSGRLMVRCPLRTGGWVTEDMLKKALAAAAKDSP